jgi:hypothetical protein
MESGGNGESVNLIEFQEKWRGSTLKESASAKEHFLDLCRVLGMATPDERILERRWC